MPSELFFEGGREFVEIKDFGVPDVVKSMAWCGENICVGVRREYMIMNSTTGALSEIFSSGRIAPSLVAPLSLEELLLGKVFFYFFSMYRSPFSVVPFLKHV